MKSIRILSLWPALLFAGCATDISVPPIPEGNPSLPESRGANSPALQPYLAQHYTRAPVEKAAAPTRAEAPMDHSKMKMEGM